MATTVPKSLFTLASVTFPPVAVTVVVPAAFTRVSDTCITLPVDVIVSPLDVTLPKEVPVALLFTKVNEPVPVLADTVPLIWFAALRFALPLSVLTVKAPEVTTPVPPTVPPDARALSVKLLLPVFSAASMAMFPPLSTTAAGDVRALPTVTSPDWLSAPMMMVPAPPA